MGNMAKLPSCFLARKRAEQLDFSAAWQWYANLGVFLGFLVLLMVSLVLFFLVFLVAFALFGLR